MEIYIILSLVTLSQCRVLTEPLCDGMVINDEFFEKQTLLKNINTPYQLAVDHVTNTLYFTYTASGDDDLYKLGYLDLRNKQFGTVSGIPRAYSTAVDHRNHKIYVGGADGIYTINSRTKVASKLDITNTSIRQLFFKDALYYTSNRQAFLYNNGSVSNIEELKQSKPSMVAVNKNSDVFYFSNITGLYAYRNSCKETVLLGKYNVNGFTTDVLGNVYFSTTNGVYYINEYIEDIELIIVAPSRIYGVALEEDGSFIYSDLNSIVRLKSTKFGIFSRVNPFKAKICLSYYDSLKKSQHMIDNDV